MELKLIEEIDSVSWDRAISQYGSRRVFHSSAWLRFIERTWGVKPLRLRIDREGRTQGYFVGMILKKGPFTILGSPMTGWHTDFLGPVVNPEDPGFDTEDFLKALDDLCRRQKIHFLQIGSPFLQPDRMRRLGFRASPWTVFSIPLSSDPDRMWQGISGKCRNRVRKGVKNGLTVEDCEDPAVADQFYEQHVEVFKRQDLPPRHSIGEIRNLFENLKPADRLFSLRVKWGEETIATGLFPHDDRHMHSFGIASRTNFLSLCPNELLYWTAMCLGGRRGIKAFSIGGAYSSVKERRRFKDKFNGDEVSFYRFGKSYSALGYMGHKAFQTFNYLKRSASVVR